jgi:outer membrane biosynthesis protein TonB
MIIFAARVLGNVRYRVPSAMLMMALLIFPGTCKKKKPELPPQSTAPTTQPAPQQPQPTPTEPTTPPSEEKKPAAETPSETKPAPKQKPHTTTRKKPQPEMRRPTPPATANKPATPPQGQPQQQPPNVESGQLTASLTGPEAARKRQETAQLLAFTEGELKGITRTLSTDEQNIVIQIRGYMQQAQAADKDGDLDRARNLATKAKLLADDLAKNR